MDDEIAKHLEGLFENWDQDRKLVGVHCIADIASEIVGIGQMLIGCGGTMNTLANMSMNTPTYSYAYKYAAYDRLRRARGQTGVGPKLRRRQNPSMPPEGTTLDSV